MRDVHFALCAEVATETHRDGTGDELGETAEDDDLGVSECGQARRQGKGNSEAIRETNGGVGDDSSVDVEAAFFAGMMVLGLEVDEGRVGGAETVAVVEAGGRLGAIFVNVGVGFPRGGGEEEVLDSYEGHHLGRGAEEGRGFGVGVCRWTAFLFVPATPRGRSGAVIIDHLDGHRKAEVLEGTFRPGAACRRE